MKIEGINSTAEGHVLKDSKLRILLLFLLSMLIIASSPTYSAAWIGELIHDLKKFEAKGQTEFSMLDVWSAALKTTEKLQIVIDDKKLTEDEGEITGHSGDLGYIFIYIKQTSPVVVDIGIRARTSRAPGSDGYNHLFANKIFNDINYALTQNARFLLRGQWLKNVEQESIKQGKKIIKFGTFYEAVTINPNSYVSTYQCTLNGQQTLTSFAYKETEQKGQFRIVGNVMWDDLAEYKSKSSAEKLREIFLKYNADLGPVSAPASQQPQANAATQPTTKSASDRLKEIQQLHKDGLINDQEYEQKKKEILGSM